MKDPVMNPDEILKLALAVPRTEAAESGADTDWGPAIEAAKKANPGVPLYGCDIDGELYLFRPVPRDRFEAVAAIGETLDDDTSTDDRMAVLHTFVEAALVHPTIEEVEAEMAVRPALVGSLASEIMRITGAGDSYDFWRVKGT